MPTPQPIPPIPSHLEDGADAWLRYKQDPARNIPAWLHEVYGAPEGPIRAELRHAARALSQREPRFYPADTSADQGLRYTLDTTAPKSDDAFAVVEQGDGIELRAASSEGLLYGTFHLLKCFVLGQRLTAASVPTYAIRMLNQWDDPVFDHTQGPFNVTRGMAGNSIFNWDDLCRDNPRVRAYARLMASVGLNAICINNVNANPDVLETRFLPGLVQLAEDFRPWGIKLYIAICFSAPMVTDGVIGEGSYGADFPFCMRQRKRREQTLDTADPCAPTVQNWWRDKCSEIYAAIPDFGGFVIKANSEGMPGPQDYGRTHADGANCIARGLAPHGGRLFYRTFIYHGADKRVGPRDPRFDGAAQAYMEFKPLDGQFDDNVILQTKCGPADFRPDEPPSPLFGAMPGTRQAIEFMVAQEYLGYTTHVVYQGGYWAEILNFDTHIQGEGTTVAAVTSGHHSCHPEGAIVGVANTGDDPNWFGHHFAGANLYAFGCLAWNALQDASEIARDWAALTFGPSQTAVATVTSILGESYRLYARYTAPLGLNLMHERAHHFEPDVARLEAMIWNANGAGYNRTEASGTRYLSQYHAEASKRWEKAETTPLAQLLFFHHLPWDHPMPGGETLLSYVQRDRGEAVDALRAWLSAWEGIREEIDPLRWAQVFERLYRQYMHACKWRDAGYDALRRIGKMPLAPGSRVAVSTESGAWIQEFSARDERGRTEPQR